MRAFSVAEQDAAIRHRFPAFRLTGPFDFMDMWRGPLRPLALRNRHRLLPTGAFRRCRDQQSVGNSRVLNPAIGLDPRGTGEKPPHIFGNPQAGCGWTLCLFGDRNDEWGPHSDC